MAFEDALNVTVTIGKLAETQNPSTGDITTAWEKAYVARAYRRTLRGVQRMSADMPTVFATDRLYMPLVDSDGAAMALDETMEAVETASFDYDTQKGLPRFRFKLVNIPHGHHFEVDTERIGPGGS